MAVEQAGARGRGRPRVFSPDDALMAAVAVFAEKGYEHTSLSDLTAAMGINRPSMYLAFGSKEDLFLRAMKAYQAQADALLTECMSGPSARAGIEALLRAEVEMATGPDRVGVSFITQPPLTHSGASGAVIAGVEECRASVYLKLKDRFDQAVRDGELPPEADTDALGRFYSITIQGLALDAQHGGTRQQLLRAVDIAVAAWPGAPRRQSAAQPATAPARDSGDRRS